MGACLGAHLGATIAALATPGRAAEWEVQGAQVRLDTTLTFGTVFRVERPDPSVIGVANGGRLPTLNVDNGNLNYRRGGLVAAPLSGVSELEVQRGGFGVLVTGEYWLDPRNLTRGSTDRTPLSGGAVDLVGRGGRLLNAYAYGRAEPMPGMPVDVRLGAVALNWGEASLIPNGISVVSPYDLTRLHAPGAALREALLPVPMVNATLRLAPGLSLEGFVQFKSETDVFDPAGTYFSGSDLVGEGAASLILGSTPPVRDVPPFLPGTAVPRGRDRGPRDLGQYGLALRWSPAGWDGTELGLFWLQYNSRLPLLSINTGVVPPFAPPALAGVLYPASSRYFSDYPNDTKLLGVTVSTRLPGNVTLRAEASWRFGQPLQVDFAELGFAALSPLSPVYASDQAGNYGFGQTIQGWRRYGVGTAIANLSRTVPGMLGADQLVLLYEAGLTAVPDLPGRDRLRFAGGGSYTSGNPLFTAIGAQPYTSTKGFTSRLSGGHRLVAQLDFFNLIGSVTISPRVAYAQDLAGNTPLPLGTFVGGRQAVSVGVTARWLSSFAAGIEYVSYSGAGSANLLRDRDYVASYLRASF